MLDAVGPLVSNPHTITFTFGDDRPPETVPFKLAASDEALLGAFLRDATELEKVLLALGPDAVRFTVSAQKGDVAVFGRKEPTVLERAALLHHLRPFVLENEPYSFYKAKGIVDRSSESPFLQNRLREIKHLFSGNSLRAQMVMSRGDVVVNSESVLKKWLNAFEYHRDPIKAQQLEESLGGLPLDSTRPIFLMLLISKGQAVLHLGHIIDKMLRSSARMSNTR